MAGKGKIITFRSVEEVPLVPVSLADTLYNKTGGWRYLRPVYEDKRAPCAFNCPSGEDIPVYLGLISQGRFLEAWEVIRFENPFPAVTGRVCPHPCETECNRNHYGGALSIHRLERFVADVVETEGKIPVPSFKPEGPRIAVIGSGPAGLSCAYHLARKGYRVTVFEALPEPGGLMRYGIPDYRLPKDVLMREIALIEALGVEIRTGMKLGGNLSWGDLRDYAAVFLAVGFSRNRPLEIPGENAKGVIPALEFLKTLNLEGPGALRELSGKKVAVIGGGNSAMDAARSALRLGAEVTIYYRRTREEMPAIPAEIEEAEEEGIRMEFLTAPIEVITMNGRAKGARFIRMRLGEPDASGRPRPIPVPGSEFTVDLDYIIPAVGQEADWGFLDGIEELKVERGRIKAELSTLAAHRIFAGGDIVTGFGTVTHAIGSGKRAALAIDRFLRGETLTDFPPFERNVYAVVRPISEVIVRFEDLNLAYYRWEEPLPPKHIPLERRRSSFEEVNVGLSVEEAVKEAGRCFVCGTCVMCDNCLIFCPDRAISRKGNEFGYEIDYDYCKGCGVCVSECPRDALSLKEEILFIGQRREGVRAGG
ncbi:MAG: NAD(P)-binding protein [Anaerolineae bacterium]|nr:NAD(P)-binding protein [Anaerolineae bacterium]MDW8102053.1 NAD(P)-binding protein [Anaerolineae bacterium]